MNIFFAYIHYLSPKTVRSIIHFIFSPPPPVLFQIFLWKGFKYKQFPAQKIIQIQNVPQCSAANNECFILLNIHYLIQQTNNLEFFCMRIPLNFSSFFCFEDFEKIQYFVWIFSRFLLQFDNRPVQSLNSPKVKHSMEIIDFVASLLRYPTALWIFNYQFTECIWLNRVNTTTSTKKTLYTEQKKKFELILIFSSIYSSSSFFPVFPPKWKQNNY